jgi:N-acetylneuraminic acid mutarotase
MPTTRQNAAVAVVDGIVYVIGGDAPPDGTSLTTCEAYNPATNSWTTKPSMSVPRTAAGVAVVGKTIYVIGGATDTSDTVGTLLRSVEAFDTTTGTWTAKAPISAARIQLMVAALNGKIYACGGSEWPPGPEEVATLEEYDPQADTWTVKAPMSAPRRSGSAIALNGMLYAIGGLGPYPVLKATVEAYDPATDSWTTKASMATAREYFPAAVLGGEIYALGGLADPGDFDSRSEVYNPSTNSWRSGPSLTFARFGHGAAVVGNSIYVFGGSTASGSLSTVEVLTPACGTWTTKAPMPTPRAHLGVGIVNGIVYAVGGHIPSSDNHSLATLEAFDPATNTWATRTPMPTARRHVAVGVVDGILYAAGGINNFSDDYAVLEAYDPATDSWTSKASMPEPRRHGGAAVVNGILYVIGGYYGGFKNTVFAYDPTTNTWSTRSPMPTARAVERGIGVVGGVVYVLGGEGVASARLNTVEAYDPATDTWTMKAPLPVSVAYGGAGSVGGILYHVGGSSSDGSPLATVQAYDPGTDSWALESPMPTPRNGGPGVGVVGGILYAIGGNNAGSLDTVEAFDPSCVHPTVTVPGDIVRGADPGSDGATVNFVIDVSGSTPAGSTLTVRDATSGEVLFSGAAAPGAVGLGPFTFSLGTSVVEVEITDSTGRLAFASFTVQVSDTTPPVLAGVEAKTVECLGHTTAVTPEVLGISATDSADPHPTVTLAPSILELGSNTVTATARDASGNTATSDFEVLVVDTLPPVFTVIPSDVSRPCVGMDGATVAFDVRAEDLCGELTIVSLDETGHTVEPAGSSYAIGVHTVTCTATDSSGNRASCSFQVTIVDDDAPVLVCPGDITAPTDVGKGTAAVFFSVTATDACDPSVGITCTTPGGEVHSGDPFPLGLTTVTCTARDRSGNTATGSFRILVVDREAPVITAPATPTLVTDCAGSALSITPAVLGVSAIDNADPAPRLACTPLSLSPGTTSVDCTATDASGNVTHASVSVTVLRGPFQVQFLRPLDGAVDNLVKAGQTIPLKVRVSCNNVFDSAATATVDSVTQIDGSGTPVANETVEDSGLSNDNGIAIRLADGQYVYNLSTKGWASTSGARFRVKVRVQEAGHVDTFAEVVLKNR